MRHKLFTAIFAAAAFAGASAANAMPTACTSGPMPALDLVNDGCFANAGDTLDVSSGGTVVVPNSGNDFENLVEAAIFSANGEIVDLSLYGKTDDNPGLFDIMFDDMDEQSGTWDVLDNMVAIAYISIKAANGFVVFDVQGANSGIWSTLGLLNNGGQQPELSHISFWTVDGMPEVPLPAALPLFLAGLGGLGLARRRKKS